MIIGSWDLQPLGMRQVATWHFPGDDPALNCRISTCKRPVGCTMHVQPYIPMRRATHEEWIAEQRGMGKSIPDDHERATYYYEVSTD